MPNESPRPSDIRHANALSCIQVWRSAAEPLTIAELAQRTGLSRPTIDAVLEQFVKQGLVNEMSADASGAHGGRPARRFRFEGHSGVAAGIEAAPDWVTVVLADLRGTVVGRASTTVDEGLSASQRLGIVTETVQSALSAAGVPASRLRAACVGVSGVIGHDGKITRSFYVPDWNSTDIAARLSSQLGCDVFLENDIKLAAFAEHHLGSAQLASDSVFFHVGRHIAFAITIGGRIHQGAHRSAGELASLRGMRWTSNTVRGEVTWTSAATLEEVTRLAEAGDESARTELESFVTELAARIVSVALVVDPDVIVLGGEYSAQADFVARLRAEIDHQSLLDAKPGVLASSLGREGTLVGALASAFQHRSEQLYGTPGVPVPELRFEESASARPWGAEGPRTATELLG